MAYYELQFEWKLPVVFFVLAGAFNVRWFMLTDFKRVGVFPLLNLNFSFDYAGFMIAVAFGAS